MAESLIEKAAIAWEEMLAAAEAEAEEAQKLEANPPENENGEAENRDSVIDATPASESLERPEEVTVAKNDEVNETVSESPGDDATTSASLASKAISTDGSDENTGGQTDDQPNVEE